MDVGGGIPFDPDFTPAMVDAEEGGLPEAEAFVLEITEDALLMDAVARNCGGGSPFSSSIS